MPDQLSGSREALRIAWAGLSERDLGAIAGESGARLDGERVLSLRVMDRVYSFDLGSRTVVHEGDGSGVKPHLQVLAIHYLLDAGKAEPSGEMVTFREFVGGAAYFPAYRKRTLDLLVSAFGADVDSLRRAGERIGGTPVGKATVGFRARFFPKLDVDVLLWAGDEEVPSSANLLFDSSAGKMLSTEDITVVAGSLCSRLMAVSRG